MPIPTFCSYYTQHPCYVILKYAVVRCIFLLSLSVQGNLLPTCGISAKEIQHMKRRRIFYSVLPVLILFLLVPGGIAVYYLLANPTTAQVSIRPSAKSVQNLSTLTVVTNHPNVVHHQIV